MFMNGIYITCLKHLGSHYIQFRTTTKSFVLNCLILRIKTGWWQLFFYKKIMNFYFHGTSVQTLVTCVFVYLGGLAIICILWNVSCFPWKHFWPPKYLFQCPVHLMHSFFWSQQIMSWFVYIGNKNSLQLVEFYILVKRV